MSRKQPLVFIPGLLGSMGEDIIPGTGDWGFGPAAIVYNDFIDILEKLGYKKGENLFICFYNWKKNCTYNAETFLHETIQKAKDVTGADKVNVIAHSMGGLVTRSYIASTRFQNEIDKMILIGCPNDGAVDAYYLWAEGELPDRKGAGAQLLNILLEGYLAILKNIFDIDSTKELIHQEFQSIKDLLPSSFYGSYLYYLDDNDIMRYILYQNTKYKNSFLDELNSNLGVYRKRGVESYIIGATGRVTNKSLQLDGVLFDEHENISDLGKISSRIRTYEGDGTALLKSALEMVGIKYVIESSHSDMLLESEKIIRQILKGDFLQRKRFNRQDKEYIGIVVLGKGRIFIDINDRVYILKRNITIRDLYYYENNELRWLIIEKTNKSKIAFSYQSHEDEQIEVMVSKEDTYEHHIKKTSKHGSCSLYEI